MPDSIEITPVAGPINGTVRPPGSKSISNRALVLAALAEGTSRLTGILDSQDTRVMIDSLQKLGLSVEHHPEECICTVQGSAGNINAENADLWLENSGTSIRFLTSLTALGKGTFRLDGIERMRERPIGDLVRPLNAMGAAVRFATEGSECPPIVVDGTSGRFTGGSATIKGDISSQFLSSLLMSAPATQQGVTLAVEGELVSVPYVTMTLDMMKSFGAATDHPDDLSTFTIAPQKYVAQEYNIEPDASAASYLFGVAAVTGGTVTVTGLSKNSLQGDIHFVSALERMGCEVVWNDDSVTVSGKQLHGVDIDMNHISDTAQTLAAVAVFADSATTIRNVGHMRHKETDRVAAVVNELRRAGIEAEEIDDGLRIVPGSPQPADIQTYDDHRMAMSFSLLGLRSPGIRILDPDCTSKTYPAYFEDLQELCRGNLI